MRVILNFYEIALCLKVGNDRLARLVSVHARIFRIVVDDFCVGSHNVDYFKTVAFSDLKVVGVVCGGDLNYARTEIHLNVLVGNDGYLSAHKGYAEGLADKVLISFVLGVNGNGGIA